MLYEFSRTELLLGKDKMGKLANSKVAVFGIGGVGSFTVEGLIRAGVGKIVLIDDDCICITNINRQLHATRRTIGNPKVEVMKERILEINPNVEITTYQQFYEHKTADQLIHKDYDYIVDAIDTVSSKVDLVIRAKELNIPIISCMGAGNKLDPTKFEITNIFNTSICPLARAMRKQLREKGIEYLKVVYSKEEPITPVETDSSSRSKDCVCSNGTLKKCTVRHQIPGSISFVPSVAGLIIASEVIKDLLV